MSRGKKRKIFALRIDEEASYSRPSGPLWQPAADIYRCPGGWKIKLDLAGVKPDDVQLFATGEKLIVRGVRRDSILAEGWSYYQLEITYSRFERVIAIPGGLADADIVSEYRDGWLLISVNCGR